MLRRVLLCLLAVVYACQADKPHDPRVDAADYFTRRYADSRFAKWHIRETSQVMDDSLIEALHYGAGAYAIVDGGVQNFLEVRGFRGVIYTDPTKRHWTFGVVPEAQSAEIEPCH